MLHLISSSITLLHQTSTTFLNPKFRTVELLLVPETVSSIRQCANEKLYIIYQERQGDFTDQGQLIVALLLLQ